MIVRIAELEIDLAQLDVYKSHLAEEIETSVRIEPGVLFLHSVSLKDAPHKIRLLECYADEAAYQAHLRSEHFRHYKTLTAGMVVSLTLIEVDPLVLAAKPIG